MPAEITEFKHRSISADREVLRGMLNGYQVSQALHVVVKLGIAELLADGPVSIDTLAFSTRTHAATLYRVLRTLAAIGVFHEGEERDFSLLDLGDGLRSDAPDSLAAWANMACRAPMWAAWSALGHSVETGGNAFEHVHGKDIWTYRAERPDEARAFDLAMRELSSKIVVSLADAVDFKSMNQVVDVGGGDGTLLAGLALRHPHLHGTVIDLPHAAARAQQTFEVAGLTDRCKAVSGSFFDSIVSKADGYVLKAIIHDWDDGKCNEILRTCLSAMTSRCVLLVVERILDEPNKGAEGKLSDLNMLVNPGGQERSLLEVSSLLVGAGLSVRDTMPLKSGWSVVIASPTR